MDGSKEHPPTTAGLDIGDKYSYLCFIDREDGEVVEDGRLRTTPEALRRRFASERPMRIAIEAGTHSPWVSRLSWRSWATRTWWPTLASFEAHLRQQSQDRRGGRLKNLARLARLDPKLLYPLKHRGEEAQAHMAIIRSREALVSSRTQLVNHVRGTVKSFGARLPKCPARSFHKRAQEHIPGPLLPVLGPILEQIGSLTERIKDYDRKLESIAKESYPGTELLRQVEGIGRLPSCSPWRTPTASKRAAPLGPIWGWCQPGTNPETGTPRGALPRA